VSTKTLVVSEGFEGHRLVYVRLIAGGLLDAGQQVAVSMTREGIESEDFTYHLSDIAGSIRVIPLPAGRLSWKRLRRLADAEGCTRIVLPDGDRWAMKLSVRWPRSCQPPVTVLVTQDPDWSTDPSRARRARLKLKSLLLALGEHQSGVSLVFLGAPGRTKQHRKRVAPDPVIFGAGHLDPFELREEMGMDQKRYWFLVAGGISARKNLPLVVAALMRLSVPDLGLLVAGPVDPAVRLEIDPLLDQAKRWGLAVILNDRVHSDHEINCAVQATDAVVVAYSTDSPNSMTAKGVRAGRAVVVAGSPVLCDWARDLGIQLLGSLTLNSLANLLESAVGSPPPPPDLRLGSEGFVREFI